MYTQIWLKVQLELTQKELNKSKQFSEAHEIFEDAVEEFLIGILELAVAIYRAIMHKDPVGSSLAAGDASRRIEKSYKSV